VGDHPLPPSLHPLLPVADLEGVAPAPPPLGDWLTPSLTVLLICDNGNYIWWRHYRHFYLFKHEKQGTQNVQNDSHQKLCDSFRAHQIRFRPDPAGGAYSAPPDALPVLRLLTSKGKGEGRKKGRRKEEKERKGKGRGRSPFHKFLDPPLASTCSLVHPRDVSCPNRPFPRTVYAP